MIDAEHIREALIADVERVLEYHGIKFRRRGDNLRTHECPTCGHRTRDAVRVSTATGAWRCCAHDCHGDVFALVGGYAGIDCKRDFRRVVDHAAQILGIGATLDVETRLRIEQRQREHAERLARENARRDAERGRMPARWEALARCSLVGERYLLGRGIGTSGLRDVVRYTELGEPSLPLRDLETGAIVGIQRRRVDGGEPKSPSLWASKHVGTTLHGQLTDLAEDGVDVAVVVEGLIDTLVARLAFPGCAVFGAPGATALGEITGPIARRVRACRGMLFVVPHDDDAGVTAGIAAVLGARAEGLELGRDLLVVDIGEHKDLADAWVGGWRWTWPREAGGAA